MTQYLCSPETRAELERRFTYHRPCGDQPERYEFLRGYAREFAVLLTQSCPGSRELSLALTKLEEVVFWANAAIARNEQHCEPEPAPPTAPAYVPSPPVMPESTVLAPAPSADSEEATIPGFDPGKSALVTPAAPEAPVDG